MHELTWSDSYTHWHPLEALTLTKSAERTDTPALHYGQMVDDKKRNGITGVELRTIYYIICYQHTPAFCKRGVPTEFPLSLYWVARGAKCML
jgi:hypothetical protein